MVLVGGIFETTLVGNFFTERSTDGCNRLPAKAVSHTTVWGFKHAWDKHKLSVRQKKLRTIQKKVKWERLNEPLGLFLPLLFMGFI